MLDQISYCACTSWIFAVSPMRLRCHLDVTSVHSTRNRSDGMTFECKQAYGEQKGLRFFNFPVHDSSNFLPDLSRKGKSCTKNGFRVYILYFEPYAARRNNRVWTEINCNCVVYSQVREPVVCPNQHVFCSNCMDMWLRSHSFCPTCRTSITTDKPCKKILGKIFKDST